MKLESIWEPSPFPVEVPPADRVRLGEPAFSATPWISEPPWLSAQAPQAPGDVGFAKGLWRRDDALMLLVPLTREAAEDRHNQLEDYVLATRLANGLHFTFSRGTGWDRDKPQEHQYVPDPRFVNLSVKLHGASYVAALSASPDEENPDRIEIRFIDVHELPSYRSIWHCFVGFKDGKCRVHDYRTQKSTWFDLTDDIRALARGSMPKFGEHVDLAAHVQTLLQRLGYGEVK